MSCPCRSSQDLLEDPLPSRTFFFGLLVPSPGEIDGPFLCPNRGPGQNHMEAPSPVLPWLAYVRLINMQIKMKFLHFWFIVLSKPRQDILFH